MRLLNWRKRSGPTQVETLIFDGEECTELVAAAVLVPQPSNPHDPNAVMVQVDAKLVGYLARADAVNYRALIRQAGLAEQAAAVRSDASLISLETPE